jgi:hypothetical protein
MSNIAALMIPFLIQASPACLSLANMLQAAAVAHASFSASFKTVQ